MEMGQRFKGLFDQSGKWAHEKMFNIIIIGKIRGRYHSIPLELLNSKNLKIPSVFEYLE